MTAIDSLTPAAVLRSGAPGHSPISIAPLLAVFTVGRLLFVPIVIAAFMTSAEITTVAILLFVAADLYDGVLARRYDADGLSRRALDSIVDRLTIDACLIGAWASGAMPLPIVCALLGRDLYLALLCHKMMRSRRVAIKADWLYRSLNLSVAAWALAAPFVSADLRVALALALLGYSLVVACDLTRSVRTVLNAPATVRGVVIDAGLARRGALHGDPRAQLPR